VALHARQKIMDCHAFLRDWSHASALRGFESKAFGRIGGFPLLASSKGDPSQQCIYLSSGIHGDEPSGPQALLGLLNEGFF
jgi:predicted deacylase